MLQILLTSVQTHLTGSAVDFDGCPVFTLPLDNNKVSVTSASCIGTTDGSIGLSIEDASYAYSVTVTGKTIQLL